MGILPLKKRVNRDKCSFATKQRMFGVFAIDEILRYRGSRIPGSPTLCHPVSLPFRLLKGFFFVNCSSTWFLSFNPIGGWCCTFSGSSLVSSYFSTVLDGLSVA